MSKAIKLFAVLKTKRNQCPRKSHCNIWCTDQITVPVTKSTQLQSKPFSEIYRGTKRAMEVESFVITVPLWKVIKCVRKLNLLSPITKKQNLLNGALNFASCKGMNLFNFWLVHSGNHCFATFSYHTKGKTERIAQRHSHVNLETTQCQIFKAHSGSIRQVTRVCWDFRQRAEALVLGTYQSTAVRWYEARAQILFPQIIWRQLQYFKYQQLEIT